MRRLGHGDQHVGTLFGAWRFADHVQAMGYQGVFKLQHSIVERSNFLLAISRPRGCRRCKLEHNCLRVNQFSEALPFMNIFRAECAPPVQ